MEQTEKTKEIKEVRPFILFTCDLLQDNFILIFARNGLAPARAAHPNVTIYHLKEFELIFSTYTEPEKRKMAFKKLHRLKKEFGGWLQPIKVLR